MSGAESSPANQSEDLDIQIQELEKQQTLLEGQHKSLNQELEQLYANLIAEFERRWPSLKTSGK